jgi:CRISPR-associated protein Cas5
LRHRQQKQPGVRDGGGKVEKTNILKQNNMEYLDLSILTKLPDLNSKVILEIEPLAPLSMVSELPGSYYKTLKSPDKKILCGLFENILGWHIDLADRKLILKDLEKLRKKQIPKVKFIDHIKGSTYCPLLMDYFEILLPIMPVINFYDDLWNRAYRRSDAVVHPKGTFNISYELIPFKRTLKKSKQKPKQIDDASLEEFFKNNHEGFPLYYSIPTTREFIYTEGKYFIQIAIDNELYKILLDRLSIINIGFLGNSEGWVNLKFVEL